ncbi:MAG: hypothetical protein BWX80_04015 [Candidatus Hydrogenedentes bacterium ADurb.Bin101]|mgnify:FL=1|nr:MAG: hypothetical protein BWX80_04015 [Candidatus Hydrogenedentes bacterium ADurb.Bin101]
MSLGFPTRVLPKTREMFCRSDFLTSTGFDNYISEFRLALFYSPLRMGRKKGTDNEIANVSKEPVSLGYSWLFRHQSLFAPFFLSVTSAIRNADEAGKSVNMLSAL